MYHVLRTKYSTSFALRFSRKDFHLVSQSLSWNFDKTFNKASAPSSLIELLANESDFNVLLVLKTYKIVKNRVSIPVLYFYRLNDKHIKYLYTYVAAQARYYYF